MKLGTWIEGVGKKMHRNKGYIIQRWHDGRPTNRWICLPLSLQIGSCSYFNHLVVAGGYTTTHHRWLGAGFLPVIEWTHKLRSEWPDLQVSNWSRSIPDAPDMAWKITVKRKSRNMETEK